METTKPLFDLATVRCPHVLLTASSLSQKHLSHLAFAQFSLHIFALASIFYSEFMRYTNCAGIIQIYTFILYIYFQTESISSMIVVLIKV